MISGIRLKDGTFIALNPSSSSHPHTATAGRRGVTVNCPTTSTRKRIPWRKIRDLSRHEF